MKRFLFLVIICLISILRADDLEELKEIYFDLNGDGLKERITWQIFNDKESNHYQILVFNSKNKIIWRGPKIDDRSSPFYIGYDVGVSTPELIADIDSDGYPEMLIPTPASDITPLTFNRLKWKNSKFIPMKSAILQYNPYSKDIPLKWIYKYPGIYSYWAMSFKREHNNKIKVSLTGLYPNGSDYAEVYIHFVKGGAIIDKWIEKFKNPKKAEDNFSYIARLSKKDKYNSRGVRLKTIKDILRQDRANFYKNKYDIDIEDSDDRYFRTVKQRAKIKNYHIVPIDTSYKDLKNEIVNKNPLLGIKVLGKILYIKIIEP